MSNYFAVFGAGSTALSESRIKSVLDPAGLMPVNVWRGDNAVVASRPECLHTVAHADGDWRIWFAGELPGSSSPPWEALIRAVSARDDARLSELNGWFSALFIHVPSGKTWAVSDRRAQQPLFHYADGDAVYVSSHASSFCRLPNAPDFDPGWLYESLYFNHPVLDRSFLAGVSRVPPASILSWQPGDRGFGTRSWAAPFTRRPRLARGAEADALESDTFRAVAADYFDPDEPLAVALTGGFDSRAALAAAPRLTDVLTYTYGLAGCGDIRSAAQAATELGVAHLPIELGDRFVENIAENMVAAVRDSDGIERVLRAELLAVYPTLSEDGRTIVVGGVSGDHLFRDHLRGMGNVPHLIGPGAMAHIQGRAEDRDSVRQLAMAFGRHYDHYRHHARESLDALRERHGDLQDPGGYLRYLVYENAPKHFGGEAALATNFLRFRSLYWDPRMVELAFSTERATLGLSERLPNKDRFVEALAQARIIQSGPVYGGGKVHGIHVSTWARGNLARFQLEKFYERARRYAGKLYRRTPGLLSWPTWLAGPARGLCEELLGPEARLRRYLDEAFLDRFEPTSDIRLAGRLLSAELVLRLIEDGWPPDFRVDESE